MRQVEDTPPHKTGNPDENEHPEEPKYQGKLFLLCDADEERQFCVSLHGVLQVCIRH